MREEGTGTAAGDRGRSVVGELMGEGVAGGGVVVGSGGGEGTPSSLSRGVGVTSRGMGAS